MEDILERLSFYTSTDYRFLRFKNATYHEKEDRLVLSFLYSDSVTCERVEELRPRLEKECVAYLQEINCEVGLDFDKIYIDEPLLRLSVEKFLKMNFSILTLGIEPNDISVSCTDNGFAVKVSIPKTSVGFIEKHKLWLEFIDKLRTEHFETFAFTFEAKADIDENKDVSLLSDYLASDDDEIRIDKSRKVKNIEYYLGKPIRERPIKIEHLRAAWVQQVIAGKIRSLARKEFVRKARTDDEQDEVRTFFVFALDDGATKADCVFFPNQKTLPMFEKLTDNTTIAIIGVYSENKRGMLSFKVDGVSWCELVEPGG